jgi:hypothetical protein
MLTVYYFDISKGGKDEGCPAKLHFDYEPLIVPFAKNNAASENCTSSDNNISLQG